MEITRRRMLAVCMGTLLWIALLSSFMYAKKEEQVLSTSLIRFHVLANSDSEEDQALKLKVRDAVLSYCQQDLQKVSSLGDARAYLQEHTADLQRVAEDTMLKEGYAYTASVSLTMDAFPTKRYGNIALPAGYYQALRIELGEASGHNWWCVMFPPICYSLDEEELPEDMETALEENLDEETNGLLHYEEENAGIQLRFKVVEWWNELEQYFTAK